MSIDLQNLKPHLRIRLSWGLHGGLEVQACSTPCILQFGTSRGGMMTGEVGLCPLFQKERGALHNNPDGRWKE